ncbi:CRISPR-associated protein Cas4 [Desulfonatronovibrio magnus]|uniref:CRISPR-associated protein Cas4 n=1 Tax=Desulfonatronovibrio magnus TaxID=698827 RepID=UPI000695FC72|nr:CRISPR-associated protein Cas4 [Desulfonatronovibrio magnus]
MDEADVLPLSALQHFLYCPRQCALIHIEGVWTENRFTAEGRVLHNRVDSGCSGKRGDTVEDRSVPVRSNELGLYGVADVLEMKAGPEGKRIPYPVEYKRGSPKIEDWDRAQLCAQAMCLEEMLSLEIPEGAIFYGKPRRREKVVFDNDLRDLVKVKCLEMRSMVKSGLTPPAQYGKKCKNCSLTGQCMPTATRKGKVEPYILKGLED